MEEGESGRSLETNQVSQHVQRESHKEPRGQWGFQQARCPQEESWAENTLESSRPVDAPAGQVNHLLGWPKPDEKAEAVSQNPFKTIV